MARAHILAQGGVRVEVLERVGALVWSWPTLVIFSCVGIYLTHCASGIQLRHFGACIGGTAKHFTHGGGSGGMSPFQALSTALGGTVGTGNVAGVTLAIAVGGPGVLFWMWVSAFLGMATKYSEVLLAVKFRERNENGERVGGPMYYIRNGLGRSFRPLAYIFAMAGALAAFGMGSAVQAGEIRSALSTLCTALSVKVGDGFPLAVGLIVSALAAAVLLGGAKRLGSVTGLLVPFMSIAYIAACTAVLCINSERILPCLAEIVQSAFTPGAALGACVGWGFRRGVFSNEAGLGSSPIAHASTTESDCVRQGMAGVFEVFADTIVICTLTGLTLLVSGVMGTGEPTTALNAASLSDAFGSTGGAVIIAVSITLFAFSSLLSWGYYGARCCEFMFGLRSLSAYRLLFCAAALVGAVVRLDAVWLAADVLNAMMAAPNLIALVALSGTVRDETRRYFAKRGK